MICETVIVMQVTDEDFSGTGRDLSDIKDFQTVRQASVVIYNGSCILKNRGHRNAVIVHTDRCD